MSIAANLKKVKEEIEKAKAEAGRDDNVTLVAVTKYSGPVEVLEAAKAGQTEFAENRVQMLTEKWKAFDEMRGAGTEIPEMNWHLIGHLQTNKVKYVVGKVKLIHSVDSFKLAEEISRQSVKKGVTTHFLVEVNVSGEESKSGVRPEEVEDIILSCSELPNISIDGLMTMAPKDAPEDQLVEIFTGLRKLFIDMKEKSIYNCSMTTLSMGMSADFVAAVKCGSNMVRVGHRIFSE